MAYTIDSKLGDLYKDDRASAIIDKHIPGASTNGLLTMTKPMTLKNILSMPVTKKAGVNREVIDKILEELNALPPK
jgi:hypothetical protein